MGSYKEYLKNKKEEENKKQGKNNSNSFSYFMMNGGKEKSKAFRESKKESIKATASNGEYLTAADIDKKERKISGKTIETENTSAVKTKDTGGTVKVPQVGSATKSARNSAVTSNAVNHLNAIQNGTKQKEDKQASKVINYINSNKKNEKNIATDSGAYQSNREKIKSEYKNLNLSTDEYEALQDYYDGLYDKLQGKSFDVTTSPTLLNTTTGAGYAAAKAHSDNVIEANKTNEIYNQYTESWIYQYNRKKKYENAKSGTKKIMDFQQKAADTLGNAVVNSESAKLKNLAAQNYIAAQNEKNGIERQHESLTRWEKEGLQKKQSEYDTRSYNQSKEQSKGMSDEELSKRLYQIEQMGSKGAYRKEEADAIIDEINNRNPQTIRYNNLTEQDKKLLEDFYDSRKAHGVYGDDKAVGNRAYTVLKGKGYTDAEIKNYANYQDLKNKRENATQKANKLAQEHPILASVVSVGTNLATPLQYAQQLLNYADKKLGDNQSDYHTGDMIATYTDAVRSNVANRIESKLGHFGYVAYQSGMSMADNIATTVSCATLIGALGGAGSAYSGIDGVMTSVQALVAQAEPLTLAIMGTQAAGRSYAETIEQGGTENQAALKSVIAGSIEIITEKIGIEAFLASPKNAKAIITNMRAEGAEEVVSSAVNLVSDILIMGDDAQIRKNYQQYVAMGMSDKEAAGYAVWDEAKSIADDYIGGAMAGAGFGSLGAIEQYTVNKAANSNLVQDYNTGKLLEALYDSEVQKGALQNTAGAIAEEGTKDSKKISKTAEKLSKKDGKGKNSAVLAGKLYRNAQEYIEKKTKGTAFEGITGYSALQDKYMDVMQSYNDGMTGAEEAEKAVKDFKSMEKFFRNLENATGTVQKKSGKAGEVGFNRFDAEMKLTDGKGNTASIENAKFQNEAQKELYQAAFDTGNTSVANHILENYNPEMDAAEYVQAYKSVMIAGRTMGLKTWQELAEDKKRLGISLDGAEKLDEETLRTAINDGYVTKEFRSGLNDLTTRPSDVFQSINKSIINQFAKDNGLHVVLVDRIGTGQDGRNGAQLAGTNTIVIAADAEGGMTRTVAHETYHYLKENNAEGAARIAEVVKRAMKNQGMNFDKTVQSYIKNGYSEKAAADEVIADSMFDVFNEKTVAEIIRSMPTEKAKTFADYFAALVKSLRETADKWLSSDADNMRYAKLRKEVEAMEQVRDLFFSELAKVQAEKTSIVNTEISKDGNSYKGRKAKDANLSLLLKAEQMEQDGSSSEEIRRETGWFRGMDKVWRYEISDIEMKLIDNPKIEEHENDGEYYFTAKLSDVLEHEELFEGYPELKDYLVIIQNTEPGTMGTTFAKDKMIVLNIELFSKTVVENTDYFKYKQEEISKIEQSSEYHEWQKYYEDEYQEKYSAEEWLVLEKNAMKEFFNSDLGKRYYQLVWGKDNNLKKKIVNGWSDAARSVLLHELQHAVQEIEGFARGSSPEYWKNNRQRILAGINSKKAKAKIEFTKIDIDAKVYIRDKFGEEGFKKWMDYQKLLSEGEYDALEKYTDSEFELFEKMDSDYRDKLHSSENYEEIIKSADALSEKEKLFLKDNQSLYLNTAGEIEARDTEKRLDYSDEQRKNIRPDIDREDVVFADSESSYSIVEPFVDDNGNKYENAVLLDTNFFDGFSPRNWGKKLKEYVESRSVKNPFIMPIFDEKGKKQILSFAKKNERVTKNETSHKVIGELYETSDNISKLSVIHIDEIVEVSEENVPYFSVGKSHQWLDAKGWLHRNANVINVKNGTIYNLTFDVAKTIDGRAILYTTNGKINRVGHAEVNSLKIKGSGQKSNSFDTITNTPQKVNNKKTENNWSKKKEAMPEDVKELLNAWRADPDRQAAYDKVEEIIKTVRSGLKHLDGGKHFLSPAGVEKIANKYAKETNTEMSREEIKEALLEITDYIADGEINGNLDADTIVRAVSRLARKMVDESSVKAYEVEAENGEYGLQNAYENIKALKGKYVFISPAMQKELNSGKAGFDSYDDFKRKFSGIRFTVDLQKNVDNGGMTWQAFWDRVTENCDYVFNGMAEKMFSDAETDLNQPEILYNVFSAAKKPVNRYTDGGLSVAEAAESFAEDIIGELFNLPTWGIEQKAASEIRRLRDSYETELRKLRKEEQKKYDYVVRDLTQRLGIQAYEASQLKAAGTRKATNERKAKTRNNIIRNVRYLETRLRNPKESSDGHIPLEMKKLVENLVFCFNTSELRTSFYKKDGMIHGGASSFFEAERLKKWDELYQASERFRELGKEYKSLEEAVDEDGNKTGETREGWTEDIEHKIESIYKMLNGRRLSTLSEEALNSMDAIVNNIKGLCVEKNEMFGKRKSETVKQNSAKVLNAIPNKLVSNMYNTGSDEQQDKSSKSVKEFGGSYNASMTTPIYFFDSLNNKELKRLYLDMRDGQDDWYRKVSAVRDKIREAAVKFKYNTWKEKSFTIQSMESKRTLELTAEEAMSLYATWKRSGEQGKNHIINGGIQVHRKDAVKKESKSRDKSNPITEAEMERFIQKLPNEMKLYVDAVVGFLSSDVSEWGNSVSRELYNYEKYTEGYYFPILVEKNALYYKPVESGNEKQLKNSGFTKSLVENAEQPIRIMNFTERAVRHCDEMAKYSALVVPIENFNRVYNYKETFVNENGRLEQRSVRDMLNKAYPGATDYIQKLLTDINGGVMASTEFDPIGKMLSMAKRANVMASLSVAVQQPTAIARATAMIDTKYFFGSAKNGIRATVGDVEKNAAYQELVKWAPIMGIKNLGRFDTGISRSSVDWMLDGLLDNKKDKVLGKVNELSGWLPERLDTVTWLNIWEAVKRETKDKTNLAFGSEVFFEHCGKRFTDIIEHTQVYDSNFSRSQWMRSNRDFAKVVTSFKAEPTVNYNMCMAAARDMKNGNKKAAMRKVAAVAASSIMANVAKAFVSAARDKDEDKSYLEKVLAYAISGFVLDPISWLPYVDTLYNFMSGYGNDRMELQVAEDGIKAFAYWLKEDKETGDKIKQTVKFISEITGIPVYNVYRDLDAFVIRPVKNQIQKNEVAKGFEKTRFKNALIGEFSLPGINVDFEKIHFNRLIKSGTGEKLSVYFDPNLREDNNKVLNAAKAMFKDGEISEERLDEILQTYQSHLDEDGRGRYIERIRDGEEESTLKETDIRVAQAAVAFANGDTKTYDALITEMSKSYDQYNVSDSVDAMISSIQSASNAKEQGDTLTYADKLEELTASGVPQENVIAAIDNTPPEETADSYEKMYNDAKLKAAITDQNDDLITKIFNEKVEEYKFKGETEEDAKESASKKIVSQAKAAYRDGNASWDIASVYIKKYSDEELSKNDLYLEKKKIDGGGSYYGNLKDAINEGDNTATRMELKDLMNHGVEGKDIRQSLSGTYKKTFLDLYKQNRSEAKKLREKLINVYVYCGASRRDAADTIDGWLKTEKKKS